MSAHSTVLRGDCRAWCRLLAPALADAIVCDPPYELGFMNKRWDRGGVSFDPRTWRAVLRAAKPGAHMIAFGGSRTSHRIVCAIEDAGWEIRDSIAWMYGSGFPKSLDVSQAIDRAAGAERAVVGERTFTGTAALTTEEKGGTYSSGIGASGAKRTVSVTAPATDDARKWAGWGTALKPALEPVVLARKPFSGTVAANVLTHGTGALNIDACRVEGVKQTAAGTLGGYSGSQSGRYELGTGARFDATGRWPANVILDEEAARMLDEQAGDHPGMSSGGEGRRDASMFGVGGVTKPETVRGDAGGPSRFFYTAKADRAEREAGCDVIPARTGAEATGSKEGQARLASPRTGAGRSASAVRNDHPTVKPVSLMRWLVRLVTPPGGLVFDPFTGSGTTGVACMLEGFHFLGTELEPRYVDIARARLSYVTGDRFESETGDVATRKQLTLFGE